MFGTSFFSLFIHLLATLTATMACWANDVMAAVGANDRGKLWNLTTTLKFPQKSYFTWPLTTSAEVASGSTITNIIHFATTRSQVAAEAAEGAWTPNNQDPPRADEAAHLTQEDHACLTLALQQSLLNHQGRSTWRSTFKLLATEEATAAQLTVDGATLGTADHDADAPRAPPGSTDLLTLTLG